MQLVPLPVMNRGDVAVIHCLAGPTPLRRRLQELGLLPGAQIEILASGSPCILLLGGRSGQTRLCLRGDEADSILVAAG